MLHTIARLQPMILALAISILPLTSACSDQSGTPASSSSSSSSSSSASTGASSGIKLCPYGNAKLTDGHRRLALIVGVGQYRSSKIPDLAGPPNDARRFYDLLTGKKGYGFPKENVCLLLDDEATTARFKTAFQKVLVDRAQKNDIAVLYFAGHGSQSRDFTENEPDGMNETILLADARSGNVTDLIDDDLNKMLSSLYDKTEKITLIADSCNSGTVDRGASGTFVARFADPLVLEKKPGTDSGVLNNDDGDKWIPRSMPGIVALTAATDGTSALESNGKGVFTDALIRVLSQAGDKPLTYAQVSKQVPPLVASVSYQIPYFQGELERPVFGNTSRKQPLSWEVTSASGDEVELTGPPMAGMGRGAELRIYDGNISGTDSQDPGKAKATVVIESMSELKAKTIVIATGKNASEIKAGDLAILVRPGTEYVKIKVRLRPASEPGGVAAARASALKQLLGKSDKANALVEFTTNAAGFELQVSESGKLQLLGPENTIRNTYQEDAGVIENLWQHARQRALLALKGEGGSQYRDNETLMVTAVPASEQIKCATGVWEQAAPNSEQVIPRCYQWNIRVQLSSSSPTPLLVGGLLASSAGDVYGFPVDGRKVLLKPGQSAVFNGAGETFRGVPPLNVSEHLLVFGTQEPVEWRNLTSIVAEKSRLQLSALEMALNNYLSPGESKRAGAVVETDAWTMSNMTYRVESNTRFNDTGSMTEKPKSREYTIAHFDNTEYLPDDQGSALYKVLTKAHWLVNKNVNDGVNYKQHAWSKASDEENLRLGIDCSRFIWFVFTRSGLPYNSSNRYLSTADMVGSKSGMNEQFERCDNDTNFKLGDVLVYRDDAKGDGHTVMVIDSKKRIAVGSNAWDGEPRVTKGAEKDVGVEYQKIKFKTDFMRSWDRKTMLLKSCWRYREFTEQAKKPGGRPGVLALDSVCDINKQCGKLK